MMMTTQLTLNLVYSEKLDSKVLSFLKSPDVLAVKSGEASLACAKASTGGYKKILVKHPNNRRFDLNDLIYFSRLSELIGIDIYVALSKKQIGKLYALASTSNYNFSVSETAISFDALELIGLIDARLSAVSAFNSEIQELLQ